MSPTQGLSEIFDDTPRRRYERMRDHATTAAGDLKASVPNEGENRTENVRCSRIQMLQ